jgi:hypothetical protein
VLSDAARHIVHQLSDPNKAVQPVAFPRDVQEAAPPTSSEKFDALRGHNDDLADKCPTILNHHVSPSTA